MHKVFLLIDMQAKSNSTLGEASALRYSSQSIKRLLRECRNRSGYKNHKWEPGMDYDKANNAANYPFKPKGKQADNWGGDLGDWSDMIENAFVGATFDVYLTSRGESGELESNFYIRILSETSAECQDCGGKPFIVTI